MQNMSKREYIHAFGRAQATQEGGGVVEGGGWAELQPDLLDEIAKHISSYDDYVRVRAVCKLWSTLLPKISRHTRGPRLVLPFGVETLETVKNESYHLRLPEMQNMQLRGSCFGWLISVGHDGELRILDPFKSSNYFLLPPLSTFPDVIGYDPDKLDKEYTLERIYGSDIFDNIHMQKYYISKIILSCSPEEEDFMAGAIYGQIFQKLAVYRSGENKWTDVPLLPSQWGGFQDVIFHEGKIHAIDLRARLYEFDMKTLMGGIVEVPPPDDLRNLLTIGYSNKYLVWNPDGHLLLVVRISRSFRSGEQRKCTRETSGFYIFKLDQGTKRWCKVVSLGNYVLIVGYNSSIWKPPFIDDEGNCIRNCIYYTDQEHHYSYDIGVFNLEDGNIQQLFPKSCVLCPPPVWI